jgi:hypothetical protein
LAPDELLLAAAGLRWLLLWCLNFGLLELGAGKCQARPDDDLREILGIYLVFVHDAFVVKAQFNAAETRVPALILI